MPIFWGRHIECHADASDALSTLCTLLREEGEAVQSILSGIASQVLLRAALSCLWPKHTRALRTIMATGEGMTSYERQRREKIESNKRRLGQLGLLEDAQKLTPPAKKNLPR